MVRVLFTITALLVLSGCGGGGSGSPATEVPPDSESETIPPESQDVSDSMPTSPGSDSLGDLPESNFYYAANNAALLRGELFGLGAVDNALLSKSLSFSLQQPDERISVRAAYTVRKTTSPGFIDLKETGETIIVVRNVSGDFLCSIELDDLALLDSNGIELDTRNGESIKGSHGNYFGQFSSCAAPDEDVYVLADLLSADYDLTDSLVIGSIAPGFVSNPVTEGFVASEYRVDPVSGHMVINVPNYRDTEWSAFLGYVVVLDEEGLPLAFDTITDSPASFNAPVPVGGVGQIINRNFTAPGGGGSFAGTAGSIRVIFNNR